MPSAQEQLNAVRNAMQAACQLAERRLDEVRLIAVSKTHPIEKIMPIYDCGQRRFGENRVQELEQKVPNMPADIEWHLIGHLQSNKVNKAVGLVSWIHSVDSAELLQRINRACENIGKTMSVLLEVNVSGEASKDGMTPEDVDYVLACAKDCPHVIVQGFMTMAPLNVSKEITRKTFADLKKLRDQCAEKLGLELPHLSMGMSGDFELAIEEGATFIRVGTALFEPRIYT